MELVKTSWTYSYKTDMKNKDILSIKQQQGDKPTNRYRDNNQVDINIDRRTDQLKGLFRSQRTKYFAFATNRPSEF